MRHAARRRIVNKVADHCGSAGRHLTCVSPEADHRVLPPNGRDYPTFQTIIVGKNNADPYPDHAPRSTR
jgi:hypothetical protein